MVVGGRQQYQHDRPGRSAAWSAQDPGGTGGRQPSALPGPIEDGHLHRAEGRGTVSRSLSERRYRRQPVRINDELTTIPEPAIRHTVEENQRWRVHFPYTGGHFALDIMGGNAGFLKKFDGLQMEADVVTNDLGPANIQKKHVANIRWTPAKATIGIGMGKEMSSLIQRAFARQQKPFDGALHVADVNYKIGRR